MAVRPTRAGDPPSDGAVDAHGSGRQLSLGRYELLFRIASGGMAEVHAGRVRGEAGFEKLVAIKRMHPHLAEDPHFVDMFLDEARVASHVSSPHVVSTLDLGRADDGSLFLVLELVLGQSLSVLARAAEKRGQMVPLPIALEILAQAAEGLDDAHEATTASGMALGIVHRDVSPQNLLVGLDGRTRVTDFGIARALLRRTETSTGELKGKISYFSPEQARATEVDRRSDVFALGIVAWETVTGTRLFRDGEALATLRRLIDESVPNPRTVRPDVPVPVAQVILRAVSRDAAGRWQTAGEMAIALRDAAREIGRTPSAKEIGRWVADVGGDKLRAMRARIDAAMSPSPTEIDEEAATTLLRGANEPASGVVPRHAPVSLPSIDLVTDGARAPAPLPNVATAPSFAVPVDPVNVEPPRSGRLRFALVAAALLATIGGVFWLGRASSTDPSTSRPAAASAEPSAPPVVAPAPTTAAAPPSDVPPAPVAPVLPGRSKARPLATTATPADNKVSKGSTTDTAPAPAAPTPPRTQDTPPPAPTSTATSTSKTGPLLGDDAFNRDVSRKH